MNFDLSDEQTLIVESAARYVREQQSIELKRQSIQTDSGFSTKHWQQFAEMGWLALMLPEHVDGLNADIIDLCLLMEQVGHGCFHEPLIDTAIVAASVLTDVDANDSEAKQLADNTLEAIGSGEAIIALAHIDGDGRCEFTTEVSSTATLNDDKWTLNGEKQRVFYAPAATHFIVSANANDDSNGYSLFLIAADTAGIDIESYKLIDGSPAGDVTFNNVIAAKSSRILTQQGSKQALHKSFDKAIMADCARALGSMQKVMDMTQDYIKTRVQYGKPLAQFQALQHRMAEMLVEYDQSHSMLYRSLSLFDDASRRHEAASAAKVFISKAARWVCGQGIQLHGGIGVTEEYDVGHHYKAMLTFEARFGDSDWHLGECANIMV